MSTESKEMVKCAMHDLVLYRLESTESMVKEQAAVIQNLNNTLLITNAALNNLSETVAAMKVSNTWLVRTSVGLILTVIATVIALIITKVV